ncbi:hypothetical protein [Microcoleus sp. bin38.metabat.b11b12b14.051]|uniref:hypothetical protein n=1 Tax=Microcoleus sp. bin38.metabat.b11b12b14.051 TaxID=2742709 RepID=UPI0025D6BEC1|nr:hypothetical protein [Microcoleus sp. bin38.metabat.b11b12b14.051]
MRTISDRPSGKAAAVVGSIARRVDALAEDRSFLLFFFSDVRSNFSFSNCSPMPTLAGSH